MNTNGAARLYDTLTPCERLPLIIAAGARGDEEERSRLVSTAPTNLFKVPHHRGLAEGLKELANLHIVTQLERGAAYWMASATLADWDNEPGAEEASAELWNVMVNLACCIVAEADAWKKLCGAFFSFPLEEMNLGAG